MYLDNVNTSRPNEYYRRFADILKSIVIFIQIPLTFPGSN